MSEDIQLTARQKKDSDSQADDDLSTTKSNSIKEMSTWHWIVLFLVPVATVLEASLPHTFNTFMAHFIKRYQQSPVLFNFVTTITSACPFVLLPLAVPLVRRYAGWYQLMAIAGFMGMALSDFVSSFVQVYPLLFLTYSFVYGIASTMLIAVCIVILSDYFPLGHKYHILATSLYQVGYPIAAGAGSPLMAALITKFEWQTTLRILGATQLFLGIFLGVLFKPKEKQLFGSCKAASRPSSQQIFHFCTQEQLLNAPQVYPWLLGKFLNYMCWFALRTNLTTYMNSQTGNNLQKSSNVVIAYASGEILLAICGPLLGNIFQSRLILVHIASAVLMAFLTFLWYFLIENYLQAIIVSAFIGMALQLSISFGYPASIEVTGFDMPVAWAVTSSAGGLGILVSPLLGGLLLEHIHSSNMFFLVHGIGWSIQAILYVISYVILRKRRHRPTYEEIK